MTTFVFTLHVPGGHVLIFFAILCLVFEGTPFPKTFMQVAKKILSRLFRVFVHVYIHHFDRVSQMGAEAHVNTCYKHFYYFVTEFNLTDHKELEPLVSEKKGFNCLSCGRRAEIVIFIFSYILRLFCKGSCKGSYDACNAP